MNATAIRRLDTTKPKKVRYVLRVAAGEQYVGDILLTVNNRVWRHADTIPTDVVLKALLAFDRRGETYGRVIGREDQQTYTWFVLNGN
ncbi:MAG: hypothetical protein EBV06_01395 [Planctomycetia bacterium]|nr:hypothetical protein [Planctomycetia bacterium]